MPVNPALLAWLQHACAAYRFDVVALYIQRGTHPWPLHAIDPADLVDQLKAGAHFLPLPKEPAALANILEVSILDHLTSRFPIPPGGVPRRGTERGYPDLELEGPPFGGGYHAVDVKIAMRQKVLPTKSGKPRKASDNTQSRITLYTGNTYFKYDTLHWPGTFRPFKDYSSHLDVIGIYTLDEATDRRVANLELIVQEPWRVASKQRSSTTREYIGAVMKIADLKAGRGEFASEADFYKYWRAFPFKVGRAVAQQLAKLLAKQAVTIAPGAAAATAPLVTFPAPVAPAPSVSAPAKHPTSVPSPKRKKP